MKKQIFTLSLFLIFTSAYTQKNLRLAIRGEGGLTKHFIKLEENLQVPFNPSKAKNIFGFDAHSDLVLQNSETDKLGMTHYRYYQSYKGIPVENATYIAHTESGKLTSVSGSVVTEFDRQMQKRASSLSERQAIEHALNYVHAEKYAWQNPDYEQRIKFRKGSEASYYPNAVKVWYSGEDKIKPNELKLAYKVDVYSLQPLDRKYIYVDAQSGEILGTNQILKHHDATGIAATGYSGKRTLHSDYTGSLYRLRDYTKGKGVITLRAAAGHADYTSASANFSYSNIDKWALDAHYGVGSAWNFYKRNFNRNSIDNNGFALISWVNDANNPDNAYWDGSEMVYGNLSYNGKGVVGIDVIGHEITHGVTEYTSALIYSREPGAINESMSDIMGKSVQFSAKPTDSSWILSNDMGWEIRSFTNPNANGQPDTYMGTYWSTGSFDNYGVHINSGVGNFMFYLLVKGGSGTNDIGNKYGVSGIGLAKADQILYRTNTTYLTNMSQYSDWRLACIQAATDLYGAASNEVKQVQNAWYAVGVGTAAGSVGITYCVSKSTNTAYEYINKVVLGTISNTSGNNNGYKDYTSLSANLTAGKTYSIALTPGFTSSPYTEYWTVYIDYNKDGILNGPGETVAGGSGTTAKTLSFTVPATARTGATRLRIQMSYGSSFVDPCATFNYGEVEDYTVNISSSSAGFAPLVSLNKEMENSLTVSPNPVTGSNALIQYQLAADGKAMMRLIDMNGRTLQNADLGYQKAGLHVYHLNIPIAPATGNYIIILEQNNRIIERKHIMINK